MTDALHPAGSLSEPASAYLAELDTALTGVDRTTAIEILAEVRQELAGLDATEAASRMRALGDPAFIAAEAQADAGATEDPTDAAIDDASLPIRREPIWLSVLAALLVGVGGFIIPVVGALMGYVLLWLSTLWTRRQKWIATLTPVAVSALLSLILTGLGLATPAPENGASTNPQLPAGYDLLWSGVLLHGIVQLAIGIWLLIIARRNWLWHR